MDKNPTALIGGKRIDGAGKDPADRSVALIHGNIKDGAIRVDHLAKL